MYAPAHRELLAVLNGAKGELSDFPILETWLTQNYWTFNSNVNVQDVYIQDVFKKIEAYQTRSQKCQ
jgi:hypothetical protein